MTTLPLNELACASPHKLEPLCNSCKRNLQQFDITDQTTWENFKPSKILSTKPTTYKCVGYLK